MKPDSSRIRLCLTSLGRLVFVALLSVPVAARGADDPPREKPPEAVLPGRIFLTAQRRYNVQPGLLAVDPNDRTCVTITTEGDLGVPRVSPDGRRIALHRIFKRPQGGNSSSIWVIDADGEKPPVSIFDERGTVCWAGRDHLVISATGPKRNKPGVWLVNADGSGKVELPFPATDQVEEASADGQWLLSYSARAADPDVLEPLPTVLRPIFLVHRDGKSVRQLVPAGTPGAMEVGGPPTIYFSDLRFSPDGKRVLYTRYEVIRLDQRTFREHTSLWVVDVDGNNRRPVVSTVEDERYGSAAWAPDGKTIAVVTYVPLVPDSGIWPTQLQLIDPDGKNPRTIPLLNPRGLKVLDWH